MNGCDHMDQNKAFQKENPKMVEKDLLLDLIQMNGYILYKLKRKEGQKSVLIKEFKDLLIDQLTLKAEEQLIGPAGETSGLPETKKGRPSDNLLATHTLSNMLRKTGDVLYAVSRLFQIR
ncbi:hypothetical protein PoB_001375800 [Plakobranchus ocellatus]|uniref:Uncharacterized protein n=1 Tax=Plakobranchus ocellatus TaxID=259542 RepID=A0AAV3YXZ8_9GAST|nr:hypothetical protein PoB_001375800 [Plakobranchus ocellatus]